MTLSNQHFCPEVAQLQVVRGQATENFRRHPLPTLAHTSFSLLYTDADQALRTLDLTCRSPQEFKLWYWGLHVSVQDCVSWSITVGDVLMPLTAQGCGQAELRAFCLCRRYEVS